MPIHTETVRIPNLTGSQVTELQYLLQDLGLPKCGSTVARIPTDRVGDLRRAINDRRQSLMGRGERGRLNALASLARHLDRAAPPA